MPENAENKKKPMCQGISVGLLGIILLLLIPWAFIGLLVWLPAYFHVVERLPPLLLFLTLLVLIFLYEMLFKCVATGEVSGNADSAYTFDEAWKKPRGPFWTNREEKFKRLTYVLDRLQSRIGDEYTDVASRTGWLVAGQAFLLTGFVTVLNAELLSVQAKHWLSIGVGLTGAAISFVLALSILFGHALIDALKTPRDEAEKLAAAEFGVTIAGVAIDKPAHKFGHYATRYIPCLAYVAWVGLTLLASKGQLEVVAPVGVLFPPVAMDAKDGRGWTTLEPSPPFALGATTFEAQVPGCPSAARTIKEADDWLKRVVTQWKNRKAASPADVVILVGGADRIQLNHQLKRQYDTNVGLARNRAEEVKKMLMAATAEEKPEDKLTDQRIGVLVTGPQYRPMSKSGKTCDDPSLSADRRVEVWLPAGS